MTQEQKIRAFSAYIGCDVSYGYYELEERSAIGILDGVLREQVVVYDFTYYYLSVENCKLLLTPLSKLTDEDAIDIAKICDNGFIGKENICLKKSKDYICITTGECDDVSVIRIYTTYFRVDRIHEENPGNRISCTAASRVIDYLRSKYYILPFEGFDLVKESVAIEK